MFLIAGNTKDMKNKLLAASILAFFCSMNCAAQDEGKEPNNITWSIYLDNDNLALDSYLHVNEDRDYTMGLAGMFSGKPVRNWFIYRHLFDGLEQLPWVANATAAEAYHSVTIGDTAFTPDDLENREVIEGDRPYANLTFISATKISAHSLFEKIGVLLLVPIIT